MVQLASCTMSYIYLLLKMHLCLFSKLLFTYVNLTHICNCYFFFFPSTLYLDSIEIVHRIVKRNQKEPTETNNLQVTSDCEVVRLKSC